MYKHDNPKAKGEAILTMNHLDWKAYPLFLFCQPFSLLSTIKKLSNKFKGEIKVKRVCLLLQWTKDNKSVRPKYYTIYIYENVKQ